MEQPRAPREPPAFHEYDEIDPAKVFEAAGRATPDVLLYAQAIEQYLAILDRQ